MGNNLYRPRPGNQAVETEITPGTFMAQGFLETTNVDAVYEMVNMIEAQRQFEAYSKIMQTSQAIDREVTSRIGRGRGG
jgi:flagellar basal-body rod protein FlgG